MFYATFIDSVFPALIPKTISRRSGGYPPALPRYFTTKCSSSTNVMRTAVTHEKAVSYRLISGLEHTISIDANNDEGMVMSRMNNEFALSRLSEKKIAIIGFGVMGQSIMNGFIKSGLIPTANLRATTMYELIEDTQSAFPDLTITSDNEATIKWADVVIFCLKPKILLDYLEDSSKDELLRSEGKLFISIAAGVELKILESRIKSPAELIRVMPNVAASVQQSMNIVCPSSSCSTESKLLALELFQTSGRCRELPENQFDVATALCGSGPAFFCTIIEGLVAGAVKMGLNPAIARELATQTMEGTARMILESGNHPAVIRDSVTTPGGCTISGLAAMEEGNIRHTLSKAIEDCTMKAAGGMATKK